MNSSHRSARSVGLRWACVGLTLAMASITNVNAQTYQGSLRGAVRDGQGVIPGAEVALVSEETNAERSAMTNEVGEYAFTSVSPGIHTIRVSLPGFRTEERNNVRIGTQQSLVLDFMLEVGAISELITVTGNGYLIEGVSITDLTNRPTIAPSMEAVEELKVQTKTYEADMGHAAGGVFNTTARSGSNVWHGSALLASKPGATTGTLFFAPRAGFENELHVQLADGQPVR